MEKKVIVLDFDGTLYSGKDIFKYVPEYIERNRRKFLNKVSDQDYEMICRENPDFLKAVSGSEVTREIYKLKEKYTNLDIDTKGFVDCQENEVYNIYLDEAHIVDASFIDNLCLKYCVYVVSNSAISHLHYYMSKFGINISAFKKIISNQFEEFDPTKKHYYLESIETEGILPKNLYVYGDSQNSDLKPALEIGANAFLVKDTFDLQNIIESTIND